MKKSSRRKMVRWVTGVGIAGLAGCSSVTTTEPSDTPAGTSSETPTDTPKDQSTDTPTPVTTASSGEKTTIEGDPIRELRVDEFPASVPFTGQVTVLQQPSGTEPGRLRIVIRNDGSEAWQVKTYALELPFHPDGTDGVVVTHHDNYKQENNCVRGAAGADAAEDEKQVASGGEIRGRHYLITNRDATTCFPAGEHQLQNGYSATPIDEEFNSEGRFAWGFTLVLQ